MDLLSAVFLLIIIFFSFVARNLAVGHAASWQGDPTARLQGRLTANPLNHLDMFGSVLLPGILLFSGTGIIIGWPKPIPYNPYNFKDQKWGEVIVGLSGTLANLGIAVIFSALIRFLPGVNTTFIDLAVDVVVFNLFLAIFNLIPIPPLDGSKILQRILPIKYAMKFQSFTMVLEKNPVLALILMLFIFVFVIGGLIFSLTLHLSTLMTGLSILEVIEFYR